MFFWGCSLYGKDWLSFAILHMSQGHRSFDCTCQAQMATDGQEKEKESRRRLSGVFKCSIREIWQWYQWSLADLDTVLLKSHPLSHNWCIISGSFIFTLGQASVNVLTSPLQFPSTARCYFERTKQKVLTKKMQHVSQKSDLFLPSIYLSAFIPILLASPGRQDRRSCLSEARIRSQGTARAMSSDETSISFNEALLGLPSPSNAIVLVGSIVPKSESCHVAE